MSPHKALLVLDDAPCQLANELVSSDIKALFLPSNVTPLLQSWTWLSWTTLRETISDI